MEKTPEEILLKLIKISNEIESNNSTYSIRTEKGFYELYLVSESKDKDLSFYNLVKTISINNLGGGVIFKYEPISDEIIWKYLKGQAPKQELINEIFE